MGLKLSFGDVQQQHRVANSIRNKRSLCSVDSVAQDCGRCTEGRLIKLKMIIVQAKIGNGVRPEIGPKNKLIRTVASGHRISFATDKYVGTVAAQ